MNKKIKALFVAALIAGSAAQAQYQTVTTTSENPVVVNVAAGQVMQVLNFTHDASAYLGTLQFKRGELNQFVMRSSSSNVSPTDAGSKDLFLAGPGTVTILTTGPNVKVCMSYKLFDNSTLEGAVIPSAAVVIPTDAVGPVQIILESSSDMITWTAATPGDYGSSTAKRFFRVRAVTQ